MAQETDQWDTNAITELAVQGKASKARYMKSWHDDVVRGAVKWRRLARDPSQDLCLIA